MFGKMLDFMRVDIGIDLGTCNTLVAIKNRGIIINEPSVVVVDSTNNKIIAIGQDALKMIHRTPGYIRVVRPLRDGVIADLNMTERMIKYFLDKILKHARFVKPRIAIGVPSCITDVEKRAVVECTERAGASEIRVIHESLAAAIGVGLPVFEPEGNVICDIGGGTTEISVISLGGMVVTNAIRVGGDEFDEAIIRHLRTRHNLSIKQPTAERIKIEIGNIMPDHAEKRSMEIRGRDAVTGLPHQIEIDSREISQTLREPFQQILDEIKKTLAQTPDELVSDIIERGLVITGGGSLLTGIDVCLAREINVPVILAEDPLLSVAQGAEKYFMFEKELKKVY